MRRNLRFIFRGSLVELNEIDPTRMLLEWLREARHATGTKEGCNEGDCGACTIILARWQDGAVRYQPVNACILLLGMVDGCEVLTVEDLAKGGALHPVQQAMVRHHGAQCGFCTPGIVMSLVAAYLAEPRPVSRETIAECLAGNLCRCTGYRPIFDAAAEALADPVPDDPGIGVAGKAAALQVLADGRDLILGHDDRFFAAPAQLDTFAEMAASHPEATLVSGATDVGLWITKKLQDLPKVIALNRIEALKTIAEDETTLFLGAGVTHTAAMPALARIDPDLDQLMKRFASRQVRASGTIGGNIANGSPIGDLAPALVALGCTLHLRHGAESRDLPLEDFFIAYGKQDRRPGEWISGLTITRPGPGSHFRCFKISKRTDEDISTVMGAFRIELDAERRIVSARIAFGGMAATPRRAAKAEAALVGLPIAAPAEWAVALRALAEDYQPISDMRATAAYRSRVARALLGKALTEIGGARSLTRIQPRGPVTEAAHV
ncbi:xanthine dehydrogenase small subunit [Rhabdaerophilum sp. SD176]|uniref:xanthine dehydrogenase small subunit n=1 Tax=Rhabdaerophilum sp. SD176 TaxID=2983548 RepID=UPI0024E0315D|nr:xanthine dehydrogenase small subunit [Rhabdaerophilum sp. SD176]